MTDLFEKSIHTLELPRVLELLADQAVTEEGKQRCLALRPMTDAGDVRRPGRDHGRRDDDDGAGHPFFFRRQAGARLPSARRHGGA